MDEYMWTGVWPSMFFNLSRREPRVRPWGVGVRLGAQTPASTCLLGEK